MSIYFTDYSFLFIILAIIVSCAFCFLMGYELCRRVNEDKNKMPKKEQEKQNKNNEEKKEKKFRGTIR